MATATFKPDSGIQLLIVIGAGFLAFDIHSGIGTNLLVLGVGAWTFYNLINISR